MHGNHRTSEIVLTGGGNIELYLILLLIFVIYPMIYYAVKNAILDAHETIKKQEENLEPTIDE